MTTSIYLFVLASGLVSDTQRFSEACSVFNLPQGDLQGFLPHGKPHALLDVGTDNYYIGEYRISYLTRKSDAGRDSLRIIVDVFHNDLSGKSGLEQRRAVYQAPSPHGSLTGMTYADQVDHEVGKNSLGVIALKGRFIVEVSLSFPDTVDRRKSFLASKLNDRKLLVDTIASKLLARAAAQTWPTLGKHK